MPEGGLRGVRHSPQTPEGDIDPCDLGPGDLTVGAGGSELLLHVDLGSLPEQWPEKDWSVLHVSSRHAALRIGGATQLAMRAGNESFRRATAEFGLE